MPQPQPGEQPIDPDDVFNPQKGDYDVTISSGMSYQSQRAAGSDFVDTLIQNLGELPLPPQAKATLLARAISLKDIGPIGDDLAKIIDPQGDGEPVPPQAQQMIGQLQQQLQVLHQANTELQTQLHQLDFDKKAQIVKGQTDIQLKQMQIEADITMAEINTKAQNISERMEFVEDMVKQLQVHAHESALSAQEAQQGQDAQQQAAQQQQAIQSQQQGGDDGQSVQGDNAQSDPNASVQPSEDATG